HEARRGRRRARRARPAARAQAKRALLSFTPRWSPSSSRRPLTAWRPSVRRRRAPHPAKDHHAAEAAPRRCRSVADLLGGSGIATTPSPARNVVSQGGHDSLIPLAFTPEFAVAR